MPLHPYIYDIMKGMSAHAFSYRAASAAVLILIALCAALPVLAQTEELAGGGSVPGENGSSLGPSPVFISDVVTDRASYMPGDTVTGTFVMTNASTQSVSNVRYVTRIVGDYAPNGLWETEYALQRSASLALGSQESRSMPFSIRIPSTAGGALGVNVQAELGTGMSLGWADGRITVTGTPSFMKLIAAHVSLNETAYDIGEGPTLHAGEEATLVATLSNPTSDAITVVPHVSYATLDSVIRSETLQPITVGGGESYEMSLPVRFVDWKAGVYTAHVTFADARGEQQASSLTYRFIIDGPIRTIQTASADAFSGTTGDTIAVTVAMTGQPMDINPIAASTTESDSRPFQLSVTLRDEKGAEVGTAMSDVEPASMSETLDVVLSRPATALLLEATLSQDGKVLSTLSTPLSPAYPISSSQPFGRSGATVLSMLLGICGLALLLFGIKRLTKARLTQEQTAAAPASVPGIVSIVVGVALAFLSLLIAFGYVPVGSLGGGLPAAHAQSVPSAFAVEGLWGDYIRNNLAIFRYDNYRGGYPFFSYHKPRYDANAPFYLGNGNDFVGVTTPCRPAGAMWYVGTEYPERLCTWKVIDFPNSGYFNIRQALPPAAFNPNAYMYIATTQPTLFVNPVSALSPGQSFYVSGSFFFSECLNSPSDVTIQVSVAGQTKEQFFPRGGTNSGPWLTSQRVFSIGPFTVPTTSGTHTIRVSGGYVLKDTLHYGMAGIGSGTTGTMTFALAAPQLPPPPTSASASCNAAGNRVTLSWTAAPGATAYYPRVSGTPIQPQCSQAGWQVWTDGTTCYPNPDGIPGTSVANFPVIPGQTYGYYVHSGNANGVDWNQSSGWKTFSCADTAPVATLSNNGPIAPNTSATLTYTCTNSTSATIQGIGSVTPVSGGTRPTGPLAASTNYQLTCTGPGGSDSKATTVVVANPTISIDVTPDRVNAGSSASVTWDSDQCTNVVITRNGATISTGVADQPAPGLVVANIASQTTFKATCDAGSATDTVIVNLVPKIEEF